MQFAIFFFISMTSAVTLRQQSGYQECSQLSLRQQDYMRSHFLNRILKLTNDLEREFSFEADQVFESFESILNCHQCSSHAKQYLRTVNEIRRLRISKRVKIELLQNALFVQKFCQAPYLVQHKSIRRSVHDSLR